ncbi:MAG: hypothetical protein WD490_00620 [Opitutales bacterium]
MNHPDSIPFIFFLILAFLAIGLPVLCGTLIALTAIFRKRSSRDHRVGDQEETELIQQLHQTCLRLEQRIEALETIILETERRKTTK